eukprot:scaffold313494_cov33-Tisochrysis_lutea.AAC.4
MAVTFESSSSWWSFSSTWLIERNCWDLLRLEVISTTPANASTMPMPNMAALPPVTAPNSLNTIAPPMMLIRVKVQ